MLAKEKSGRCFNFPSSHLDANSIKAFLLIDSLSLSLLRISHLSTSPTMHHRYALSFASLLFFFFPLP